MRPPGKIVVDEFYVHLSALEEVESRDVKASVQRALEKLPLSCDVTPNVAKVNLRSGRVSLLAYPDFESAPFPELAAALIYPPGALAPTIRRYDDSLNPPILHRKERLVTWSHPGRARWEAVTRTAESIGLFDETSTIGFKLNWMRLISSKGFQIIGEQFLPLANVEVPDGFEGEPSGASDPEVRRHLTALTRTSLSAPVQLLIQHGVLRPGKSFFDYGCGRGGDVTGLRSLGYESLGWDPHYARDQLIVTADVVNLGFVINVIEDPAERIEALTRAFALARSALSVGVMLAGGNAGSGTQFRDGWLTSRNTFQKYFTQAELRDFLEQVLHRQAFMVAPGIAFVFADQNTEQMFAAGRFRTSSLARRLLASKERRERVNQGVFDRTVPHPTTAPGLVPPHRLSATDRFIAEWRPVLERIWQRALDLGRIPDEEELSDLQLHQDDSRAVAKAIRLLPSVFDVGLMVEAAKTRRDDLLVFMASQHFAERSAYRQLAPRLKRDIKAFFGDYGSAQDAGLQLMLKAADPAVVLEACKVAAARGLGHLEAEHSLQLHVSMVERLPPVLRAYVACGLQIWDSLSDVQLVKIHVRSGKLTLLQFDDFDESPLPLLRRRIKIHVRRLSYDIFEYGSDEFPQTAMYGKSRFLSEEYPGYAEQLAFDEMIERLGIVNEDRLGPRPDALARLLASRRLEVSGMRLVPSRTLPQIDEPCGAHFTYRDLIECGQTQRRLGIANLPLRSETFNALHSLCVELLDPLIDYFGAIQLTYGFASPELTKHIQGAISPKLDQHASCELTSRGAPVCARGGAACDFLVEDEDMAAVADWIVANLPFDRLYFYGHNRPLHMSWSSNPASEAFALVRGPSGRLLPKPYRRSIATASGEKSGEQPRAM
jgi:DNA phosphorothioation-associated putative methyltransferase